MSDKVPTWTEYIGVARTANYDGLTANIEVYIPDFLPNFDGDIPLKNISEDITLKDPIENTTVTDKINHRKTVYCTWFGNTNTIIPCVHVGERVRVYQYAGTTNFYWEPLGQDHGIRLRERWRMYWMSQPTSVTGKSDPKWGKNYTDVSPDNSYWIDVDTRTGKKAIWFHTSMADGEDHTYDCRLLIDHPLGKCIFEFFDSEGNILRLDTHKHKWYIKNADNSYIDMEKENITIHCNDTMTLLGDKKVVVKTPDYQLIADKQTITGKTRSSNLSNSDDFQTKNMSIKATKFTSNADHSYSGPNFVVGTASGLVPVIIHHGSNSW